ncbi:NAD/NADP-dependent octopine/nopaline dehydrogenase family protein [Janibacter corallicola]|uniref:NAD/NADP-dependent octopine/nopaline dehydrogenase family protein n=1 Tax=Janibacter corallicola TaxID=415212 RepID=UPI000834CE5C|nr:NAD/NADP-dependent octopine/nopaline dehydrogenase family protein [Janibacter corallicola]
MKIAVLGGGHGCYAAAADLGEQGHEVRLWRRSAEQFGALLERPVLTLKDEDGSREVTIAGACTDIAEALAGADLVLIPSPAVAQRDIAAEMAPHLVDGQVVFLPPGTFGSWVMSEIVRESGNTATVAWAETGTLPWLARKHGDTVINISARATRLPTGVYPAADTDRALEVIGKAFPSVERCEDALSGALMNAGPIIHPPLILMNAGPLEHFPAWDIHNEGTQPSIRAVTTALDHERIRVREALGYGTPHFPLADHYENDQWMYGDTSSHAKLVDSGDWREKIDLHEHRYMREDTALGLAFLVSVAAWAGVDVPVASGLLALAGAVVGEDLRQSGRTLGSLGLAGLTRDQLTSLLSEGRR